MFRTVNGRADGGREQQASSQPRRRNTQRRDPGLWPENRPWRARAPVRPVFRFSDSLEFYPC